MEFPSYASLALTRTPRSQAPGKIKNLVRPGHAIASVKHSTSGTMSDQPHCGPQKPMRKCGMTDRILYCHGLPGSPEELAVFDPSAAARHVHALDRLSQPHASYEARVLAAFDEATVDGPVTVAGFSLGAMSAARIAAKRAPMVRKLILISPAAPLQLGDFLPAMAGKPVFEAAQRGEALLRIFTALQASLVALAPNRILETMFSKSPEADKRLLVSPGFRDVVTSGLRNCLGPRQAAYRSELRAYVQPWAGVLDEIRCETEIWQGSDDDWTPPAMAQALKTRLGAHATLKPCVGLGHYSTLLAALAQLH
jgi:pimeloyl-ACP methyl ester carboxylesterase